MLNGQLLGNFCCLKEEQGFAGIFGIVLSCFLSFGFVAFAGCVRIRHYPSGKSWKGGLFCCL
jgi:hypothetical protein